ncbi:sugar ABC transporter permease [Alicyclobacillus fastidiosus]|uniref:Sugar ABC transporter permease n=1 Tax=Alicyclobacillus fastidiosus TaxID=392011 RepID=A0ABY6ZF37_9BACL|nr:sugar ABC transporter permease [Alicyclobacillus fastidiosus]WAH41107.1 sugar ABC transporter permease [Alicyclobacillus fastidiosus]GMA62662.1 sugar ABC transporter permease [Alicyclobacillus fastidiosus]
MKRTHRRVPYGLLAPFFLVFLLFFAFPFLYSLYLSFFVNSGGKNHFIGLRNYGVAWQDTNFWYALFRVVYYGVVQVAIMLILALALALLLDSRFVKSKAVFRIVYFLPYAVPGVIAAIMWGFLYSPQLDPILSVFKLFTGGNPVNILSNGHVLYGIVNMAIWEWTGYNMTIYFASLTSIPIELYDAAKIDGCNETQVALHIKLPLLRPTIIMTVVLSIIGSLQLFNEPFILSSMTSIPWNYTPNMEIYNMAFAYGNFTYSATLSIILSVITFIASLLFMYATSDERKSKKVRLQKRMVRGQMGNRSSELRAEGGEVV